MKTIQDKNAPLEVDLDFRERISSGDRLAVDEFLQSFLLPLNGRGFAAYKFNDNGWGNLVYYPMYITGPSYAEILKTRQGTGDDIQARGSTDVTAYIDAGGTHYTYSGYNSATWDPSTYRFTSIDQNW